MSPILATYLKRFFSHYLPVQRGLARNTILAYRDAIKLLLCHAADTLNKAVDQLSVEDIDESLVLGFLDYVETGRGCSTRTRNARLAAIRAFFGFVGGKSHRCWPIVRGFALLASNAPSTKQSIILRRSKSRRCSTSST